MSSDRKPPLDPRRSAVGDSGDEGFLDRWSRRKAMARRGDPLEQEPAAEARSSSGASRAEAAPPEPQADDAALSDAELAERYDLPDPESLGEGADYSAYMRRGVPDRLRNAALRKLWRSSPDLACLDELLEYGDDFTGTGVVGAVQTAYEVGRGFAKKIEAWEREQAEIERAALDQAPDSPMNSAEEAPIAPPNERPVAAGERSSERRDDEDKLDIRAAAAASDRGEDRREAVSLTRRRMKFRVEEQGAK